MSVSVIQHPGATWLTLLRPPVNAIDLATASLMTLPRSQDGSPARWRFGLPSLR